MGIAILSGTLSSLEARLALPLAQRPKESDGPLPSGISTPTSSQFLDAPESALPERFIATVGREESARKLKRTFKDMGRLGEAVEVFAGNDNVKAVQQSDVILVW
jgi:pyrroline-5-carboxylate reductase